jgi:hypothetical protein
MKVKNKHKSPKKSSSTEREKVNTLNGIGYR